MRTLKKSLALVLVVALVLSFGVIGASASDFTDTTDSDYTEAINVMSGIGVLNGMTSTTFEPTGTLTREQGAKIIAYMLLGPTNAKLISTATTQRFTDVATTRWSAGYIEYCANLGIIAGVGDNKFDPEGTLTTAAFTKMLLVALGYNASTEGFTGDSWAIKVAAMAVKAGLTDDGIVMSAASPATREQAAQLAFLTLTAKTVEYKTSGTTIITSDGTKIVTAGSTYSYVVGSTVASANYDGATGDGYAQFCEEHFPKLKLNANDVDKFGAPASTWTYGTTTISSAADEPTFTFTAKTSETAVTKALKGYTLTGSSVKPVENGKTGTAVTALTDIDDLTGNGKVVKIYATDTVITDIVVVAYNFGAVTVATKAATKTKGAYTTYSFANSVSGVVFSSVVDEDEDVDTATVTGTVASGDSVIYCPVYNADGSKVVYLYVYEPETVTGICTGMSSSSVATIGGETYGKSAATGVGSITPNSKSGTYYVDLYGYWLGTKSASSVTNYAYVISAETYNTLVDGKIVPTYSATVALTDGTVETLAIDSGSYTTYTNLDGTATKASSFATSPAVTFSDSDGDGEYTLTALTSASASVYSELTQVVTKTVALTTDAGYSTVKYAGSATKFIVVNYEYNAKGVRVATGTVTVYTGIANVPTYLTTKAYAIDSSTTADGIADSVFILVDTTASVSSSYVYVVGTYTDTTSGRVWDTIVNGEASTLTTATTESLAAATLYSKILVQSDATIDMSSTKKVADDSSITKYTSVQYTGGLLVTNSDVKTCAADVPVYTFDSTDATVTVTTASALTSVVTSSIVLTYASDGTTISGIYIY